jgi:hypothetical protein
LKQNRGILNLSQGYSNEILSGILYKTAVNRLECCIMIIFGPDELKAISDENISYDVK